MKCLLLLPLLLLPASALKAEEEPLMLPDVPLEQDAMVDVTETPEEPAAAPPAAPRHPVEVEISGNQHFPVQELKEAIQEPLEGIQESGLSEALADDMAFFLEVFYRKNGYSQVQISYKIVSPHTLRLEIREGPLTALGRVSFVGNKAFPAPLLQDHLTGVVQKKRKIAIPFVEGDLQSGADRIRGYYRSEGYLDVFVDEPEITLSRDRQTADVEVYIEEGTQYRFGPIEVEGDLVFFPRQALLDELKVFTDKPYTPLAVTNIKRKIIYYYRSRGYFMVDVLVESDPEKAVNGVVPSRFTVDSGALYHFNGVDVHYRKPKERRLRRGFLEARFRSLAGKPYNPAMLEERYRMVMGTGLFSNLKLTQKAVEGDKVQLRFDVEEAKAREVGFSVGYGSLEAFILGAQYTDRNFLGYGRPLSMRAEIAQHLLRGEIAYTDPWVLDTNYTLRLRLYAMSQNLKDYAKLESGLRTELARKLGDHVEISAFVLSRGVIISNTGGIDLIDLGPEEYFINSIGTSLTIDFRDSVLNPTRGLIINATNDVALGALGSTVEFVRSTVRASYYLPIGRSILALGARGGIIAPLGGNGSLPIDERFFNGGSRSIRSYVERSFGPKDRYGHSIGGQTFTVFNVEHIFPIVGDLKGAVFVDAGTTGRTIDSGLGDWGTAVGLGLRYQLPVGPIRVDYGHNPFRRADEPTGAWHLSFGFAF